MKVLCSLILLFHFQVVLSQHRYFADDFSGENYRYIFVEEESQIVLTSVGKMGPWPDINGSETTTKKLTWDVFNDVLDTFTSFNFKELQKGSGCLRVENSKIDVINKHEQAAGFIKLFIKNGQRVQLDLYDAKLGWTKPALSIDWDPPFLSAAAEKSGGIKLWKETASSLAEYLPVTKTVFNEPQSNVYFSDCDITAKEMWESNPSHFGNPQTKKVYPDVLLNFIENLSPIQKIFIVGVPSENCNGRKSQAEGFVQLASLKLMSLYSLLERTQLSAILDEHEFSNSGLIDESMVLDLGEMYGSDGIVICQETCVDGQTLLTAKLLNCVTGQQEWIASSLGGSALDLLDALLEDL